MKAAGRVKFKVGAKAGASKRNAKMSSVIGAVAD